MNCFCKQLRLHFTLLRVSYTRIIPQLKPLSTHQVTLICCQIFFTITLSFAHANETTTPPDSPKNYGLNQLLIPASERCQISPETENFPAAVVACELAANHGDPEAQYLLGHLYYQGIVVDLDHEKARHWYEQASLQGHSKAQYQLAFMYYRGIGLDQNYTQAYIMMKMAAVNGYSKAINASDEINNKLSQEQRALAFYTLSHIFQMYANKLQAEETVQSSHQ